MNRRWLIGCGAFLAGSVLSSAAWCDPPSSLAERIEQLRRGWTASENEKPGTPDETASGARAGSAATNKPLHVSAATGKATTQAPARGLPQIDARGLMPTNLFGRTTASDDKSEGPLAPQSHAQATKKPLPSTKAQPITRTATRPGTGPAKVEVVANDSFSLPGLSGPQSASNRGVNARPAASKTAKPNSSTTDKPAADVKQLDITPIDDSTEAMSGTSPRRSPTHRPSTHFDPEALRNELSGTFGETTDNPASTKDEPSAPIAESAKSTSPAKTEEPSADSPDSSKPIVLKGKPKPSTRTQDSSAIKPIANAKVEKDRYGQSLEPVAKPSNDSTKAGTSAQGNDANNGPDFGEAARAFSMPRETKSPEKPETLTLSPFINPTPAPAKTESDLSKRFEDGDSPSPSAGGVLVTNQAPAITSDIRGPKQITIGRPATYRIQLRNDGTVAADDLVASVRVPTWAEVVSSTPTHGIVRQGRNDDSCETIEWQIAHFQPQSSETLEVQLIPRTSRPLELGVTWMHTPTGSHTIVEVQEPKLRLQVTGPDEVLFGKPHSYRLTLTNPGTGVAENVRLGLLPPGGRSDSITTHSIGDLAPGSSKTVEVELTAREAGKLSVKAIASAENGLNTEATKDLFCRKPELEVDWRGPETQYSGTPANFFFRVRNPGTAAADDVSVRVTLPAGSEFVSASEGGARDSGKDEIVWKVGSLGPGDDCYVELRCIVREPGQNEVHVRAATGDGELSAEKAAVTTVIALADLKLEVTDPSGPVPVGDEAVYEIHITNRGASAAEDVDVVGLFSAGLDPEAVDGAPFNVADGRVTFRTIRKIAAGQKLVLEIRARATEPGTKVFRAEVLCRDSEIKLAAEETTRFYQNDMSREHSKNVQTAVKPAASESLR